MKNFPHQYQDLRKLRATLATVRDLAGNGADPSDDAVLGYELARRHVYTFRGVKYGTDVATVSASIETRLVEERAKSASSQGTRTAAREGRRTLRYLGWLDAETGVTPAGEALLATAEGSDEELILMQQAISNIEVVDRDGNLSHPVQILLRLVDEVDLYTREGMELALEAKDDSTDEFRRISQLAEMRDAEREAELKSLGWTDSQLANARKILPPFAVQAGLMTNDTSGRFILTDAGRRVVARSGVRSPAVRPARRRSTRGRRRGTSIRTRRPGDVGKSRRLTEAARRALTPEEQAAAAELLYQRTERHQDLVRAIAVRCGRGEFYEDAAAYDLVIDLEPSEPLVLIEVKTISGDAAAQLRAAVGQLLFYKHFVVSESFPGRIVRKAVVVDEPVADDLAGFLQTLGIGLIVRTNETFSPLNDLGRDIAMALFSTEESS